MIRCHPSNFFQVSLLVFLEISSHLILILESFVDLLVIEQKK